MSDKTLVGLVTVRTSSTRLPAKCLLPFGDGNVLNHIIRRARAYGIEPIICTSVDNSDNIIENIASDEGVRCFRGSLSNKLKRWLDCATFFGLERSRVARYSTYWMQLIGFLQYFGSSGLRLVDTPKCACRLTYCEQSCSH